jgi:hypothetical protein
MLTRGVILGTLSILSISIVVPLAAAEAQDNPTTPGAIPNPGTYQGSMELQRQSDERDRQLREEQERQQQQQQQQYQNHPQQRVISGNGTAAQQSSGPHRVRPRVPINFTAGNRASAAYGRHEYATAVAIVRPLATRGDVFAQYLLAAMYDNGKALQENHALALQWYQRSAAAGFSMSMRNLGTMYRNGEATGHSDYVQAYRWYTLSLTHAAPGELDNDGTQELNQDLSEIAVKMSGAQIAQAKELARQSNIPYLGD